MIYGTSDAGRTMYNEDKRFSEVNNKTYLMVVGMVVVVGVCSNVFFFFCSRLWRIWENVCTLNLILLEQ